MPRLLEIEQLTKRFGGVLALDAVSVHVDEGETVGLIGPNGAGKTTLFNCITGVLRPDQGTVRFGRTSHEPLTGLAAHEVVQRGLARTFQNIRLFASMSVLQNIIIGTYTRTHAGLWSAACLTAAHRTFDPSERPRYFIRSCRIRSLIQNSPAAP